MDRLDHSSLRSNDRVQILIVSVSKSAHFPVLYYVFIGFLYLQSYIRLENAIILNEKSLITFSNELNTHREIDLWFFLSQPNFFFTITIKLYISNQITIQLIIINWNTIQLITINLITIKLVTINLITIQLITIN